MRQGIAIGPNLVNDLIGVIPALPSAPVIPIPPPVVLLVLVVLLVMTSIPMSVRRNEKRTRQFSQSGVVLTGHVHESMVERLLEQEKPQPDLRVEALEAKGGDRKKIMSQ